MTTMSADDTTAPEAAPGAGPTTNIRLYLRAANLPKSIINQHPDTLARISLLRDGDGSEQSSQPPTPRAPCPVPPPTTATDGGDGGDDAGAGGGEDEASSMNQNEDLQDTEMRSICNTSCPLFHRPAPTFHSFLHHCSLHLFHIVSSRQTPSTTRHR